MELGIRTTGIRSYAKSKGLHKLFSVSLYTGTHNTWQFLSI